MDQNNEIPQVLQPIQPQLNFVQKMGKDIKYLWENNKIFLVVFGLLIVGAKLVSFVMDVMAANSKKDLQNATKKDAVLKQEEDTAKSQADTLVQEAKSLPTQEGQVNEDWNKNGKN